MYTWRHPNRPSVVGRPFVGLASLLTVGAIVAVAPATSAYASGNPPVGNNDSASTVSTTPVQVNVLANDTDAESDALTVTNLSTTCTNGGTAVLNGDNTVTYTAPSAFTGTDTCTYTPNDGTADGNVTTVTITVNANSPPVGNNDSATTTSAQPVVVNVLANDTDVDGNTLTVTNLSQSQNGFVTLNGDQTVTYQSGNGYVGSDSFTYTPNDGTADGNVTTVTITVNVQPVLTAPNYTVVVTRNRTAVLDVASSATNPCGGQLTATIDKAPSLGTATVSGSTITYKAPSDVGYEHLTYTLHDACGATSHQATVLYKVRYGPNATTTVINASPHQANGGLSFTIINLMEGKTASTSAGPDDYRVCIVSPLPQVCKVRNDVPDGQLTTVSFTGYKENQTLHFTVALVGDPASSGSDVIGVRPVVKFTASIAKYAVKTGVHKGRAKVSLLNYWSGRSVLIYVRDGFGTLHKYSVAKERNVTVYVPTPRGHHKVTVYRYYSGTRHRVTYRYVIR